MKKILIFVLCYALLIAGAVIVIPVNKVKAQVTPNFIQSQTYSSTTTSATLPVMDQTGLNVGVHQLSWVITGSVSACTVAIEQSSTFGGSYTAITNGSNQTCTTSGQFTVTNSVNTFVRVNLSTFTATTGTIYLTYTGFVGSRSTGQTDGYYFVPPTNCMFTNTTVTGTPIFARAATGNFVLQTTTNAAAGAVNLGCDVSPPSRLLGGRGVTINAVSILYGIQTAANTSITAATVNTVTYPASTAGGVAAAGTVSATAGGTLTVTPTVLQLTTTTSGQCFNEKLTFGTPLVISTDLTRVIVEQIYNQSAATAWTQQTCGAIVYYTVPVN